MLRKINNFKGVRLLQIQKRRLGLKWTKSKMYEKQLKKFKKVLSRRRTNQFKRHSKQIEKNEIDSIRKKEQKKVETEYEYYSEDDDAQEISKIWQHGKLLPITNKDEPLENLKVLSPLFQKQSAPQHRPTSFYS